ncbi:MAG: hypothetical protein ABSC22_05435 [Roseiarcus sp.]|jgi:hypothetical protein
MRGSAEALAKIALCSYCCAIVDEAAIKAEYLLSRRAITENLSSERHEALLRSLLLHDA